MALRLFLDVDELFLDGAIEARIAACIERQWWQTLDRACAAPLISTGGRGEDSMAWIEGGRAVLEDWATTSEVRRSRTVVRDLLMRATQVEVVATEKTTRHRSMNMRDVCAPTLYCLLGRLSEDQLAGLATSRFVTPRS